MLLFHYSKDLFDKLLTREKQGNVIKIKQESYLPGNYNQHISFFFDPIPFYLISKIYGKDHPVWFPGNKLYQYVVDSSTIGNFKYHIVETPEKTQLVLDDSISEEDYKKIYPELAKKNFYLGTNNSELEKGSKKFINKTREYFLEANKKPNWEQVKNKYAAYIPHVMLYPDSGEVTISEVNTVKIR